jgi:cholesterol transport system auxiliary component
MMPVPALPRPGLARRAVLLCACSLLAACSVLPRSEPVDVYLLPAQPHTSAPAAALPWALRITRPASGPTLAGRYLIVEQEGRLSSIKGARWSEPTPVLLRNRLLDGFRSDGRIVGLSSDDKAVHADFELDSDLRQFHSVEQGGQAQAVIQLDVRLVRTGSQRIVASRRFEIRQPADGSGTAPRVQAFGVAADRLSTALVDWVIAEAAAR